MIAALKEKLDRDRYPRAPRLEPFRAALAKLDPASAPRAAVLPIKFLAETIKPPRPAVRIYRVRGPPWPRL